MHIELNRPKSTLHRTKYAGAALGHAPRSLLDSRTDDLLPQDGNFILCNSGPYGLLDLN